MYVEAIASQSRVFLRHRVECWQLTNLISNVTVAPDIMQFQQWQLRMKQIGLCLLIVGPKYFNVT